MYFPVPFASFRPNLSQAKSLLTKGSVIYAYGPEQSLNGNLIDRVRTSSGVFYYIDAFVITSMKYDPKKPRNKLTIKADNLFTGAKKVFRSLNNVFLSNDLKYTPTAQKSDGKKCKQIAVKATCDKRKDCTYVSGERRSYCKSKPKRK